jgi:hypothetical protein
MDRFYTKTRGGGSEVCFGFFLWEFYDRLEAENRSLVRRVQTLENDLKVVTDRRDEDDKVRQKIVDDLKMELLDEKKDK